MLLQVSYRSYTKKAKLGPESQEKGPTPSVELPPPEDWWKIFRFPEKRKRRTICNPDTAKKLAEVLVPEGSEGKVIIEAWAGAPL